MLGVNWKVGIKSKILGGPAFLAENCLNSCMIEHKSAIFSPTSEPSIVERLCKRGDPGSTLILDPSSPRNISSLI